MNKKQQLTDFKKIIIRKFHFENMLKVRLKKRYKFKV